MLIRAVSLLTGVTDRMVLWTERMPGRRPHFKPVSKWASGKEQLRLQLWADSKE